MDHVFICQKPVKRAAPLVLDSPHSGKIYPADFGHACPKAWLEETEDSYVDELFGDAPALGVPLLSAQFPRCYIDPNRAEDDIDPQLLSEPWPYQPKPSARSDAGVGLIRRLHKQHNPKPIYDRLLTVDEAMQRVQDYYRPYHEALETLLDEGYDAYGAVFHLNCHSMPTFSSGSRLQADIVLGDRDGTTCDSSFTRFVSRTLKDMGYSVAVNRPYKGVELVRKFSDPAMGRHSLQIELKRSLYMDEQTREKNTGFDRLRRNMAKLTDQMIDFALENSLDLAAD